MSAKRHGLAAALRAGELGVRGSILSLCERSQTTLPHHEEVLQETSKVLSSEGISILLKLFY